jgi:hypothetical protein
MSKEKIVPSCLGGSEKLENAQKPLKTVSIIRISHVVCRISPGNLSVYPVRQAQPPSHGVNLKKQSQLQFPLSHPQSLRL